MRAGRTGFSTDLLLGLDLAGATVALVGLAAPIGRGVARRLVTGFGMRGDVAHPTPTTSGPWAWSGRTSTRRWPPPCW